jgi:thiosulfate dehydrogenase [quinone] large subunit
LIDRLVDFGRGVPSAAAAAWALALLRIFTGVIWLANEAWKLPPSFGRDEAGGLMDNFLIAEEHAVFGFLRTFMSDVVIPNYTLFGWLVFVVELVAGVLLTLGLFTRLGALIGGIQALIITLLVVQAPTEWFWTYAMLIALHAVLFFTPCAERLSLDSRLRRPRR